jgi:hypothetical protein
MVRYGFPVCIVERNRNDRLRHRSRRPDWQLNRPAAVERAHLDEGTIGIPLTFGPEDVGCGRRLQTEPQDEASRRTRSERGDNPGG